MFIVTVVLVGIFATLCAGVAWHVTYLLELRYRRRVR